MGGLVDYRNRPWWRKKKVDSAQFLLLFLLLLLGFHYFYGFSSIVAVADQVDVVADDSEHSTSAKMEHEKLRDEAGFDAVRQLHKQMDDDHSGSVDLDESSGFVREELHIKEKDRLNRRQQTFHVNNDNFITVDDLWSRWLQSTERNWTVDDTLEWLRDSVELPQYTDVFQKNAVDGLTLPRLCLLLEDRSKSALFSRIALQNASFLTGVLKVTNPVHRQKLQIKAMDAVLFGYRSRQTNYWKDAMLIGCVTLAVFLFAANRYQRSKAQRELEKLQDHKDKLLSVQDNFQFMQEKLQEEMQKHEQFEQSAKEDESKKTAEVQNLKQQLENAERRIEQGVMVSGYAPLALQPLLRKTCELEVGRINRDKLESLAQMKEAIETVEKLKKKQASVIYSMKLAVAPVSVMENLDQKISEIKQKMEGTARSMEECQHRWRQVESLCGYPILDASFGVASGGLPRPSSLNGCIAQLTSLPLALTSALAAVPNAFGAAGSSFLRPSIVTPTLEDIDEHATTNSSQQSIIQPKVAPQFFTSRPVQRSMVNFGTVQPGVSPPATSLLPTADVFGGRPKFQLGDSGRGMVKSGSAGNFSRQEDSVSISDDRTAGVRSTENCLDVRHRSTPPTIGTVGKTDSQESGVTVGSAGGGGTEEQKAKKRAKLMQFLSGKKEKG